MIYLDNAATARPLPQALEAAGAAMETAWGNPSSLHAMGRQARDVLETARAQVAGLLGCKPGCVVFTSGGTESINTALLSAAHRTRRVGRHIVSTAIEHDATLAVLSQLERDITLVPPQRDGTVSLPALTAAMQADTAVVSMMAVNNETGARLPYASAAAALKAQCPKALFHLDAVQALGEEPLELQHVDYASVSAHKIGGIKGAGALYVADPKLLRPLLAGGGQESGRRSGTEAMPAIAAFGAACAERRAKPGQAQAHLAALRAALLAGLAQRGVRHTLQSPGDAAPHILSLSVPGAPSEVYIRLLSDAGFCVSGGSACKRGKRSHVLAAMGLAPRDIDSTLRVSLSPLTTLGEVEAFCHTLAGIQMSLAKANNL